ncbi:MAG: 4a-hydroxytetrahydrobiopterin dehydratase [bacterium]|nr:4a-hydroxytetrahydrobiopterin dehydratase [bacterium]
MSGCVAIPEGTQPLDDHAVGHLMNHIDGWDRTDCQISKTFQFEDHFKTIAFVNALAWISHREDHHPELVVGYNTCGVTYSTHTVGGLSRNDFVCAAKVDALVEA